MMATADTVSTVRDFLEHLRATEEWRPIPNWPGYSVSSWGNVRSARRILTPALAHGYQKVSLSNGKLRVTASVHRLVAKAFLGEPAFAGAVVAHNDGRRTNNVVTNLRWASLRENQEDRVRHNTRVSGSAVHGAKLKEADIPVIRARTKAGEDYSTIASQYGVSKSTIHLIAVNKIWKSVGGAAWAI